MKTVNLGCSSVCGSVSDWSAGVGHCDGRPTLQAETRGWLQVLPQKGEAERASAQHGAPGKKYLMSQPHSNLLPTVLISYLTAAISMLVVVCNLHLPRAAAAPPVPGSPRNTILTVWEEHSHRLGCRQCERTRAGTRDARTRATRLAYSSSLSAPSGRPALRCGGRCCGGTYLPTSSAEV